MVGGQMPETLPTLVVKEALLFFNFDTNRVAQ